MPDWLPQSLFQTGRAQCPDCGAPLSLTEGRPRVDCQYCGGAATVERRLRTLEPVLAEGFVTADAPVDAGREVKPSHLVPSVAQDESHCPTCGAELAAADANDLQAIRRCVQCGTESKLERRLVRRGDADEALAAIEREAEAHDRRQWAATDALIGRITNVGADLADRVRAARELGGTWGYVNVAAARGLPRLLEAMRGGDPRFTYPAAEIVGKLMCQDDVRLHNAVLRAAEKFTFDVNGSPDSLLQVGLGSPVGLKLLLDTADYAALRGASVYACTALWAVNMMFERHYAERMRLAEIVLYRLLYLRGPVQAWAIQLCQGQLGLGCRFPLQTILRFMDDCGCERPELVPHVRKFFYVGGAETEGEWVGRLDFMNELLTPAAKASALEHILRPPESASQATVGRVLERLLELSPDPTLGPSAIMAIVTIIEDGSDPPESVHTMVKNHGDRLPEEVRRAYLRRVPDAKLLPPGNWQSPPAPPKTAFDEQLEQWAGMWGDGIRKAVEARDERRQAARDYWESIGGR
jgi:DNA-directed RNA polymerase subunit RPC12/RpoP